MIFYYLIAALISVSIILTSYYSPSTFAFLGPEAGQMFADAGMNLLWIVLFVKPIFMILVKYTELRTTTFS